MDENKKDIRRLLKEHLPRPSPEELEKRADARQRTLDQLRAELQELQADLKARTAGVPQAPWPGALEPLALAAAFLLRGEGDVESIAEKVQNLSSRPPRFGAVRFTVHRLVRRGLLSEDTGCFTITPDGERELAQARDDAKRWIDALGDWLGPAPGEN